MTCGEHRQTRLNPGQEGREVWVPGRKVGGQSWLDQQRQMLPKDWEGWKMQLEILLEVLSPQDSKDRR